jgi:hypothetical protein
MEALKAACGELPLPTITVSKIDKRVVEKVVDELGEAS